MEIRAGFEPAINSFADCPLEPLEYRIMAGIAGFEPAVPVSKTGALTPLAISHYFATDMNVAYKLLGDPRRARTEHYSLERAVS